MININYKLNDYRRLYKPKTMNNLRILLVIRDESFLATNENSNSCFH